MSSVGARCGNVLKRNRNQLTLLYLGLCVLQTSIMAAGLVVAYKVEKTYSRHIAYETVLNGHLRTVIAMRALADNALPPGPDTAPAEWDDEASRVQNASSSSPARPKPSAMTCSPMVMPPSATAETTCDRCWS